MKKVDVNEVNINPVKGFLNDWSVVFAGNREKNNAMTISWGGIGSMWNKPVVYVVIRPTRYTHDFVEEHNYFSLNFLPDKYRKELNYLGSKSGRNENKIEKSGLSVEFLKVKDVEIPVFSDSDKVLLCKVLFKQPFKKENFLSDKINIWYKDNDYHDLYIAEIIEAETKE